MHRWCDDWPLWDLMEEMVNRAYEVFGEAGIDVSQIKEKFGTLRVYCPKPSTPDQQLSYKECYRRLLHEYPQLKFEILAMSDWPELLEGLINPDECGHESKWVRSDGSTFCSLCAKELPGAEEDG